MIINKFSYGIRDKKRCFISILIRLLLGFPSQDWYKLEIPDEHLLSRSLFDTERVLKSIFGVNKPAFYRSQNLSYHVPPSISTKKVVPCPPPPGAARIRDIILQMLKISMDEKVFLEKPPGSFVALFPFSLRHLAPSLSACLRVSTSSARAFIPT